MKIKVTQTYKSLRPFESEELPKFTVITGVNGSGKSQLLEKIEFMKDKLMEDLDPGIEFDTKFKRIHTSAMVTVNIVPGSASILLEPMRNLFRHYEDEFLHPDKSVLWAIINNNRITENALRELQENEYQPGLIEGFKKLFESEDHQLDPATFVRIIAHLLPGPGSRRMDDPHTVQHVINHLANFYDKYGKFLFIAQQRNKDLFKLTEADFLECVVPSYFTDNRDLNDSKIEAIFYTYLNNRYKNSYQYFRKVQGGKSNNAISEEDFAAKYPSPWRIINDFLTRHSLDYFFKEVSEDDFSPEATIKFELARKSTEQPIPFEGLSSGEKVIISLILRLFTTKFYENNLTFPDFIFLDEPDAHLHPQMAKLLIDVLHDTFVKELGIQVIITTHSPATVALAPEDSIFELKNNNDSSLKKVSKDHALGLLMAGLPNLSLDYRNHRQVFVESPTDVHYYQTLFNKLNEQQRFPHQLYFISTGYGKSNCDQVITLVDKLRNAGNRTAWGIIDWDGKNPDKEFVKAHGGGHRYSIENFIFDPLFLTIMLLNRNYGTLMEHIGYTDADLSYNISNEKAQRAINFIMEKLAPKFKPESDNPETVLCTYGDRFKLNIPKWFTHYNGHKLKDKIVVVFQDQLKTLIDKGEYHLEEELTHVIVRFHTHAIPKETELFLSTLAGG